MNIEDQLSPLITHCDQLKKNGGTKPLREFVEATLLPRILGPVPEFSHRRRYQVSNVTAGTMGAFAVPYFKDKSGRILVVINKRGGKESYNNGDKIGFPGGYINLDDKESPQDAAVREWKEEYADAKGPVIAPQHAKLRALHSAIDYRETYDLSVPTASFGFSYALSLTEFAALSEFSHRIDADPSYAAGVRTATAGEVLGVEIIPIDELLTMRDRFSHPHEYVALATLAKGLKQKIAAEISR